MEEEVTDTAPAPADTAPVETVAETQATDNTPEPEVKEFEVPEAYKDKGWASKVKSEDDLYKQIDNLSSLVGKKEIVKQPDWDNEESRNEFVEAMRPEDKDGYNIPESFPEAEANLYKDLLYDNGVTAKQAENIFNKLSEVREKQFDADDMTAQLKEAWGSDVEANTNLVMSSLREHASKEDQAILDNMPNSIMAAIYRYSNNVLKAYGANETDIAATTPSPAKPVDVKAERSKLVREIREESTKGAPNYAQINEMKARLNKLYEGA